MDQTSYQAIPFLLTLDPVEPPAAVVPLAAVGAADMELARLREELGVLGKHLFNATQRHVEVERTLARVEEKLERVAHFGEEALSE